MFLWLFYPVSFLAEAGMFLLDEGAGVFKRYLSDKKPAF